MKAEIFKKDKEFLLVRWSDENIGFGELTMKWDGDSNMFVLDSEMMGIDTVLEILKALPNV